MSKITESTLIPISLVLTFIGGIAWLTSMNSKVEASYAELPVIKKISTDIEIQKVEQKNMNEKLDRVLKILENK